MSVVERPIAADWLALRRPVDERARAAADPLLARLGAHLAERGHNGLEPVELVDIGAGTGANRAYLINRLPFPTTWTLLDHDSTLLDHEDHHGPASRERGPGVAQGSGEACAVRRVVAGVEELGALLARPDGGTRVVTCSALLDLLTAEQMDTLLAALLGTRTPALLALTVTGAVAMEPTDPQDANVWSAFDTHQARDGRPGPGAVSYLADRARAGGAVVVEAATPWMVGWAGSQEGAPAPEVAFLTRFLTDRAEAAEEQLLAQGDDAGVSLARGWLNRRLADAAAGRLRLTLGHLDLLILPPPES